MSRVRARHRHNFLNLKILYLANNCKIETNGKTPGFEPGLFHIWPRHHAPETTAIALRIKLLQSGYCHGETAVGQGHCLVV
jgi:hypothetical protein